MYSSNYYCCVNPNYPFYNQNFQNNLNCVPANPNIPCLRHENYSYTSKQQNIVFESNSEASSYPITITVQNNCQSLPIQGVSLFIKNLSCLKLESLAIALVNPQGKGVILFYNPNIVIPPTRKVIGFGGNTFPVQPPFPTGAPVSLSNIKNVNVNFSDQHSNYAPWNGSSGIFAPNVASSPDFSFPCPSIPETNTLSTFTGSTASNGLWKVYIQDFGNNLGKLESATLTIYY